ncbi:hypothetical protein, partial [Alteromonas sp. 14N.309.X.WAT.G.H12]|uniref:hypothetical protein n=1 Tax=Alteromonas sp. 14N.309.X.WAT.G.H12 TaxID=3120824 RepID=UPI002FD04482
PLPPKENVQGKSEITPVSKVQETIASSEGDPVPLGDTETPVPAVEPNISEASEHKQSPSPELQVKAKKEADWYAVEPAGINIIVNVPTEKRVKEGVLLTNRACDNPAEVYVRLTGKGRQIVKVLASELDLVGIKPSKD